MNRIVLEVLKLNIWYLSQRQAPRYSLDDYTVGSVYRLTYKVATAICTVDETAIHLPFEKGAPPVTVISRSRNVATKTTSRNALFVLSLQILHGLPRSPRS